VKIDDELIQGLADVLQRARPIPRGSVDEHRAAKWLTDFIREESHFNRRLNRAANQADGVIEVAWNFDGRSENYAVSLCVRTRRGDRLVTFQGDETEKQIVKKLRGRRR